jgi:phenylalanyl-tRNA synthetase beta chain
VPDAAGAPVAGYDQPLRIAALAAGSAVSEQWGVATRRVDFFDLKSDIEALLAPRRAEFVPVAHPALHPRRAAEVRLNGARVGVIGELHPQWAEAYELGAAPVVFELDLDAALDTAVPAYQELSRFPGVSRDIALVVDQSVPVADLLVALKRVAPAIVCSIELFDVYSGKGVEEGKRSLAFRVLMQDTQRTLEDLEVESAISAIVGEADASFSARLRG